MDLVIVFNRNLYKNHSIQICKEYLLSHQYGIYFRINSYLVHSQVNYMIDNLHSNGMISYWESAIIDKKYLKPPPIPKKPRKLDLTQMSGIFIIFLIGTFSALLLFAVEIITIKCKIL